MQQKRKISDLTKSETNFLMFQKKIAWVKRSQDFDYSLRPCTTQLIFDPSIFDSAPSSEEWIPNDRGGSKTPPSRRSNNRGRGKIPRLRKKRLKKKRTLPRKVSERKITGGKLLSLSANQIFKIPRKVLPKRNLPLNPSFPNGSFVPFTSGCKLPNGLVVWAKASKEAWLPGRVEWIKNEIFDLENGPCELDPGSLSSPDVPIRFFGEECIIKKVARCDIVEFSTEDTYVREWLHQSRSAKGDLKFYRYALQEAIRSVKQVNEGWLKKPLVMAWGDKLCIGEISALDKKTGFCHMIYKTGFEEKIYLFNRRFHFLALPSALLAGIKNENLTRKHVGWTDRFLEKWPAIVSNAAKGLSAMQKQVPKAIHKIFCSSGRVIVLDPRMPYYEYPCSSTREHVFKIVTGIDASDEIAETCFKLCETYWGKKIVRAKDSVSLYERRQRPLLGFTYLQSPTGEALVASIWSIWELNA